MCILHIYKSNLYIIINYNIIIYGRSRYYCINNTAAALPRLEAFRCYLNRRGVLAAPVLNKLGRAAPPGPGGCYGQ